MARRIRVNGILYEAVSEDDATKVKLPRVSSLRNHPQRLYQEPGFNIDFYTLSSNYTSKMMMWFIAQYETYHLNVGKIEVHRDRRTDDWSLWVSVWPNDILRGRYCDSKEEAIDLFDDAMKIMSDTYPTNDATAFKNQVTKNVKKIIRQLRLDEASISKDN